MSTIRERRVAHCPDREATRHLASFIAEHSDDDGTIGVVLHLPIGLFADRPTLAKRRITAKLFSLNPASDLDPAFSVNLEPDNGGLFTEFSGALAVEKSGDDECIGLIVNGQYEQPLGIAEAMIEPALGRRIARTAARDLLCKIATFIEYASAHNDAARAGRNSGSRSPLLPVPA